MPDTFMSLDTQERIKQLELLLRRLAQRIGRTTTWSHDNPISVWVVIKRQVRPFGSDHLETIQRVIVRKLYSRPLRKDLPHLASDGLLARRATKAELEVILPHGSQEVWVYESVADLTSKQQIALYDILAPPAEK